MLTQEKVKELFDYNPDTGITTWKVSCGRVKISDIAGYLREDGYLQVQIKGKKYYLSHIIWLWMTGTFPKEIDHEDHVRDNNRWDNLHEVTHQENQKNRKLNENNTSGFIGVILCKQTEKWNASIFVNEKRIDLGSYENIDDAILARQRANIKYEFHQNHGKELHEM